MLTAILTPHFLLNLVTVGVGIALAVPFARLVEWISGGAGVSRQIANAHMLFNILGMLAFIGFTPLIARGLQRLIPDSRTQVQPATGIAATGIGQ